jgi:hypothetical protein
LVLAGAFILLASMGAAAEHPCAFLMGMALSSALVIWIAHPAPRPCQTDEERDFIVGLYQIGNRLASGASMERALTEAACTSDGSRFGCWAREVLGCSALSRMSLAEAMETRRAAGRWPLLSEAFRTVARCAQADGVAAGRVAVRLAGSLADIKECELEVQERSRPVVEMMRSTSVLFAPLVLGLTVGMFGMTSGLAASMDLASQLTLMAGIYIMELCAIVAYFSSFLGTKGTWDDVAYWVSRRMPLALLVFTSVSLLSTAGFARLW